MLVTVGVSPEHLPNHTDQLEISASWIWDRRPKCKFPLGGPM